MEKILSIKEWLNKHVLECVEKGNTSLDELEGIIFHFTILHVKAALKEASKKAKVYTDEGGYSEFVDENSILNAYSLENIK